MKIVASRNIAHEAFVVHGMTALDNGIERAAECLALARQATDPHNRLSLIELAGEWLELAKSAQRVDDFVEHLAKIDGPPSSPDKRSD